MGVAAFCLTQIGDELLVRVVSVVIVHRSV